MKGNQSINEESFQNFSKSISNKIHKGFILEELNDKLPFAILWQSSTILKPKEANQ